MEKIYVAPMGSSERMGFKDPEFEKSEKWTEVLVHEEDHKAIRDIVGQTASEDLDNLRPYLPLSERSGEHIIMFPSEAKAAREDDKKRWNDFAKSFESYDLDTDKISKNMAWDVVWAKKEGFHVERMSPEKYLEKTNTKPDEPFLEKYSDFDTHTSEPIEKLQKHIKNPDVKVHIPYIGQTSGEHEGRHRAKAAMELGLKEIPVIVSRPESHRTSEIAEEFIKRQFPHEIIHETGYGDEWRGRFKKSFPEERMDPESMKVYKDILKEKGLDKDPGKFEYEYEEQ